MRVRVYVCVCAPVNGVITCIDRCYAQVSMPGCVLYGSTASMLNGKPLCPDNSEMPVRCSCDGGCAELCNGHPHAVWDGKGVSTVGQVGQSPLAPAIYNFN